MRIFHLNVSSLGYEMASREFTIAAGSAHEAIRAALSKIPENPELSFEIRCFQTHDGVVLEDSDKARPPEALCPRVPTEALDQNFVAPPVPQRSERKRKKTARRKSRRGR